MGAVFFVLAWTALSLPVGVFVGKIIVEMDREAGRRETHWGNR